MMNSLRSDSIIFRGNVVFSSLSTSTNSFKRLKPDTGGGFFYPQVVDNYKPLIGDE